MTAIPPALNQKSIKNTIVNFHGIADTGYLTYGETKESLPGNGATGNSLSPTNWEIVLGMAEMIKTLEAPNTAKYKSLAQINSNSSDEIANIIKSVNRVDTATIPSFFLYSKEFEDKGINFLIPSLSGFGTDILFADNKPSSADNSAVFDILSTLYIIISSINLTTMPKSEDLIDFVFSQTKVHANVLALLGVINDELGVGKSLGFDILKRAFINVVPSIIASVNKAHPRQATSGSFEASDFDFSNTASTNALLAKLPGSPALVDAGANPFINFLDGHTSVNDGATPTHLNLLYNPYIGEYADSKVFIDQNKIKDGYFDAGDASVGATGEVQAFGGADSEWGSSYLYKKENDGADTNTHERIDDVNVAPDQETLYTALRNLNTAYTPAGSKYDRMTANALLTTIVAQAWSNKINLRGNQLVNANSLMVVTKDITTKMKLIFARLEQFKYYSYKIDDFATKLGKLFVYQSVTAPAPVSAPGASAKKTLSDPLASYAYNEFNAERGYYNKFVNVIDNNTNAQVDLGDASIMMSPANYRLNFKKNLSSVQTGGALLPSDYLLLSALPELDPSKIDGIVIKTTTGLIFIPASNLGDTAQATDTIQQLFRSVSGVTGVTGPSTVTFGTTTVNVAGTGHATTGIVFAPGAIASIYARLKKNNLDSSVTGVSPSPAQTIDPNDIVAKLRTEYTDDKGKWISYDALSNNNTKIRDYKRSKKVNGTDTDMQSSFNDDCLLIDPNQCLDFLTTCALAEGQDFQNNCVKIVTDAGYVKNIQGLKEAASFSQNLANMNPLVAYGVLSKFGFKTMTYSTPAPNSIKLEQFETSGSWYQRIKTDKARFEDALLTAGPGGSALSFNDFYKKLGEGNLLNFFDILIAVTRANPTVLNKNYKPLSGPHKTTASCYQPSQYLTKFGIPEYYQPCDKPGTLGDLDKYKCLLEQRKANKESVNGTNSLLPDIIRKLPNIFSSASFAVVANQTGGIDTQPFEGELAGFYRAVLARITQLAANNKITIDTSLTSNIESLITDLNDREKKVQESILGLATRMKLYDVTKGQIDYFGDTNISTKDLETQLKNQGSLGATNQQVTNSDMKLNNIFTKLIGQISNAVEGVNTPHVN